jgi:hypothetical protein
MDKRGKRNWINWLGREDSNLRMAVSKSDKFPSKFNVHSEKFAKFDPLSTNRLAADSECDQSTKYAFRGVLHATAFNRVLPSRWVMGGDARLAYFYHAFGMTLLRRCYDQILGPRRYLSEFADGLCRHCNARFHLNPHTIWQATKRYVQRATAFRLVLHGLPPIRASRLKML